MAHRMNTHRTYRLFAMEPSQQLDPPWTMPGDRPDSGPREEGEPGLAAEVAGRMTDRYLAVMRQIGVASLAGTTLLMGGFYLRSGEPLIVLWWAVVMVVGAAWTGAAYWPARADGRRREEVLEQRIFALATASGAGYGAAAFVIFSPSDTAGNAVLVLGCVMGIGAAAAGNYWLKRATVGWCMLFGGITALRLAMEPDAAYRLLAVGLAFYTLLQIMFAMQAHRMQAQSIRQLILNERLAVRLDEQVRRAETASARAEQASQDKSRFLAAASHDLRQPLHAICLLTDSMRSRLAGSEHIDYFARLASSVTELAVSLDAILDISRMDAGDMAVTPEPVSVAELIAALHRRYADRAAHKGLAMRFFHRGQVIWADRGMMERLLGNLVENAIKYTATGGILVAARTRRGSGAAETVIEVRDSGIGIDASAHQAIFEEFYQLGNPARDRSEGLGLGLSIVRRLAGAMKVHVALRSAPGCGSTFSIRCAAFVGGTPSTHTAPEDGGPAIRMGLRRMRVLLVDNERAILDAANDVLGSYGAAVCVASTADEALAQAVGTRFDAAVLDFRLGGSMDGVELARRLRQVQGMGFPVLILTGDTDPAQVEAFRRAGLRSLFKPIRGDALALAIAECAGDVRE